MIKIMLCCNAGMSTSILVSKMREYSKKKGIETKIWATSINKFDDEIDDADVVLLGPQIKFQYKEFKPKADEKGKKIGVIDMRDYGMLKGDKVLETALNLLDEK